MWKPLPLAVVLLATTLPPARSALADEVTIYRCTDAKGKQTLRDSPCKRGEKQQTQSVLRPRDAKPAAITRAPTRTAATRETARYVVQPAARTLYQCVTPDGASYTSESPQGQARWQPAWTGVAPGYMYPGPYPHPGYRGGYTGELRYRDRHGSVRIGSGREYIVGAPVLNPGHPVAPVYAGGSWIGDACEPLTRAESCEVMSDRRYAIQRRYVQAMASERSLLDRESATLDARLRQECGL